MEEIVINEKLDPASKWLCDCMVELCAKKADEECQFQENLASEARSKRRFILAQEYTAKATVARKIALQIRKMKIIETVPLQT